MEKGQIVTITIEDMSAEGQGIGKLYELAAPDKAESGRAAADVEQKAETGANGAETAKAQERFAAKGMRKQARSIGQQVWHKTVQKQSKLDAASRFLSRTQLSAIVYASN